MGYNGGVNKRGYYRRFHGMYSKSSSNFGQKILTNTILCGLGMLSAIGSDVTNSDNDISEFHQQKSKHFSAKEQRFQIITWGIIACLCPIMGMLKYEYAGWWIFFSVLVFGFIELAICSHLTNIQNGNNIDFIYEKEVEKNKKQCAVNKKILLSLFIVLFILNLYPILQYILYHVDSGRLKGWDGGETLVPFILVFIKLFLNFSFIMIQFGNNTMANNYGKILPNKESTISHDSSHTSKRKHKD